MEHVWHRQYANHTEAIRDVTDYMVNFYDSRGLHSSLGYLPPNGYEIKMAEQQRVYVFRKSWPRHEYNHEYRHSAIGFVTTTQRHAGLNEALLNQRTRNWGRIHTVHLNPDHTETQYHSPKRSLIRTKEPH